MIQPPKELMSCSFDTPLEQGFVFEQTACTHS